MKSQFKAADRSGARVAVVIGPDESAARTVTVRSLRGDGNKLRRLSGLDIVTIKYGRDGKELWTKRYNSPDDGEDYPVLLRSIPDVARTMD